MFQCFSPLNCMASVGVGFRNFSITPDTNDTPLNPLLIEGKTYAQLSSQTAVNKKRLSVSS